MNKNSKTFIFNLLDAVQLDISKYSLLIGRNVDNDREFLRRQSERLRTAKNELGVHK